MLKEIGLKIREIRKNRGITLNDLAEKVGVTASLISQVERGVAEPSISTLKKLSDSLGVSIFSFFNEVKDDLKIDYSPVVKKHERKILHPTQGVTYHLLSKDLKGKIEFLLAFYEKGANTGPMQYTHRGEECALILKGKLQIQVGSSVYVLEKDDSITFRCDMPHRVSNVARGISACIWCISPPSF